jgi:ERCC4-type nuclease
MEGNCSNAKETILSINTMCKEKQTTKRERNTPKHTTKKKKKLKKWKHDLGPLCKAIA